MEGYLGGGCWKGKKLLISLQDLRDCSSSQE